MIQYKSISQAQPNERVRIHNRDAQVKMPWKTTRDQNAEPMSARHARADWMSPFHPQFPGNDRDVVANKHKP
jgi:hypothetical protein